VTLDWGRGCLACFTFGGWVHRSVLSLVSMIWQMTEALSGIPGMDWEAVRAAKPGEPSLLREFSAARDRGVEGGQSAKRRGCLGAVDVEDAADDCPVGAARRGVAGEQNPVAGR